MKRFCIVEAPLGDSIASMQHALADPASGALSVFEGRVRNEHGGRAVLKLDYQSYQALAEREGQRVLDEAIERFGLLDAACLHRTGTLAIGETAVWVGASAGHRDAAFQGCRYIIDEIKLRVPIWKRETYSDGQSEWIQGAG